MSKPLLIITNMGPKASAPVQGQFVTNQVNALSTLQPAYFFMSWHNDSLLNKLLKYPVWWLQFVWRYVFSRETYQIVHVHFYYPTIWLAWTYKYLRNPRVKIVVTFHGSDIYAYQPPSALYKCAAKVVDFFIFTSESLQQKFFNPAVPSMILPAGIHSTFAESACNTQAQKPIDVLFVGTFDRNKGIDRLITLVESLPAIQFAVVGHGPLKMQLQAVAERCQNLRLLSSQSPEALKAYYEQAKCLLSLSRNESFGLVMTEAMACYTPVIATETDGSLAQIIEGQNGFSLAQHSESQLLDNLQTTIQQLLSLSASDYRQIQQACRTSASFYFVDKIAEQLMSIYQQLQRDLPAQPIKSERTK